MRSKTARLGAILFVLAVGYATGPNAAAQLADQGNATNYPTLKQPETRYSRNGLLATQLTADFSEIWIETPAVLSTTIVNGSTQFVATEQNSFPTRFFTRVYEDMLPGPTLRLLPGDTMKLILSNQLYIPPSYRTQMLQNLEYMVNTEGLKVVRGDLREVQKLRYRVVLEGTTAQMTLAAALQLTSATLEELRVGANGEIFYKEGVGRRFAKIVDLNFLTADQAQQQIERQIKNIKRASLNTEFNRTNLHTHGLHVWPKAYVDKLGHVVESSDDVLITVLPPCDPLAKKLGITKVGETTARIANERMNYRFEFPVYHAPGTHWYHAHKDGAVAIQVQNGMAGALIIDEPEGQEILKGAREHVMVLQEINNVIPPKKENQTGREVNNVKPGSGDGGGGGPNVVGGQRPLVSTINGQYQPTVHMRPGEIQRWRIVNAGSNTSAFNKICIYDPGTKRRLPFHVVAYDGITLSNAAWKKQLAEGGYKSIPTPRNPSVYEVFVAAGNRVDILFKAPALVDAEHYQHPVRYQIVSNLEPFYPGPNNTATVSGKFYPVKVPVPGKKKKTRSEPNPLTPIEPPLTLENLYYHQVYGFDPITVAYIEDPIPLPLFNADREYGCNETPEINGSRPLSVLQLPPPPTPPALGNIFKLPKATDTKVIGHVEVSGLPLRANTLEIPKTLPKHTFVNREGKVEEINYLRPVQDGDITARKTHVFDVVFQKTNPRHPVIETDDASHRVTVNGTVFTPEGIQVQVGNPDSKPSKELPIEQQGETFSVEEWTILNNSDQSHPFHIHVNPFQVVEIAHFVRNTANTPPQIPTSSDPSITYKILKYDVTSSAGDIVPWYALYHIQRWGPDVARWQDVVTLPPHGWVKTRSRFLDFQGTYVLHCHILNHEDQGMMLSVNVGNKDPQVLPPRK